MNQTTLAVVRSDYNSIIKAISPFARNAVMANNINDIIRLRDFVC